MIKSALLSEDRVYRYELRRIWNPEIPPVVFIMLNPSTADENEDDPTIRRCINYAHAWGFGGLIVVNLYAYRSTNPDELLKISDPIGPSNDQAIMEAIQQAGMVVAAWGSFKPYRFYRRKINLIAKITEVKPVYALKMNKNRPPDPAHPLYLKADLKPFIFWELRV